MIRWSFFTSQKGVNIFYILARKVKGHTYFNTLVDRFNAQSLKCKKKYQR